MGNRRKNNNKMTGGPLGYSLYMICLSFANFSLLNPILFLLEVIPDEDGNFLVESAKNLFESLSIRRNLFVYLEAII